MPRTCSWPQVEALERASQVDATGPARDAGRAYETVARAIDFLRSRAPTQPRLGELAHAMGMSEFRLQRVFSDWAGISPKRFMQSLAVDRAKRALRESSSVLDAALESGLSGPGRLHDLMVSCEAISPGDVRSSGRGLEIAFGFGGTPFGQALVGSTARGVVALEFVERGGEPAALARLEAEWPAARIVEDADGSAETLRRIFGRLGAPGRLRLMVRGTNFQLKVWRALLRLPQGSLASYGAVARRVGAPGASRAVGSALAQNRIAFLIPCHRVLRGTGEFGDYRWGQARKRAIIAWECAREGSEGD